MSKLLLDQNLAQRLVATLADVFPESLHVRTIDMHMASDREIFAYAAKNGYELRYVTGKSRTILARAAIEVMPPRDDSKLAFYKDGFHMLMRDKAGAIVTADVAVWIFDHSATLPSGADAATSQPALASSWGSKRRR